MNMEGRNPKYAKYWSADGLHNCSPLRMAGFACNNLATNMYFMIMAMASFYLNGFVGLAVMAASSFAAVMRVWDAVTDPMIGFIIDRTNGKFGKMRPFMVIGNIGMHITSFLLFHVTHQLPEGFARIAFYTVICVVYYIFFTFQNAITRAGQAVMTNDPKQRPLFSMFNVIIPIVVMTVVTWHRTNILIPKYGSYYSTGLFHDMWLVAFCTSVVCTIIAVIAIAPKDQPEFYGVNTATKAAKISFKDYDEVLKGNKAIRWLILAACSDKFATQANHTSINIVLWGLVVGNNALSGGMGIYTNGFTIIFALLGYGVVAQKLGLRKTYVVGSLGGIVLNLCMIMLWVFGDPTTMNLPGYEGFNGFSLFTILYMVLIIAKGGFGTMTGDIVLPMISDCTDYEVYRSGKFVPGLMGTLFSLVDKGISSISPMFTGLIFSFIGFADAYPDLTTQLTPTLFAVALFIAYGLPSIGLAINIIAMKFYPLTKEKMAEIQDEIARIKARDMAAIEQK